MSDATEVAVTEASLPKLTLPPAILALLAGFVTALGFPLVIASISSKPLLQSLPHEIGLLVGAALLFQLTQKQISTQRLFWCAYAGGALHFFIVLHWLYHAMHVYSGMPGWQAVPALLLMVAYCALYWGLLALLTRFVQHQTLAPAPLAFAIAVVCCEWARASFLTGFPWALWGYAAVRNQPVLQWASITGVWGLSFLLAFTGSMLAHYLVVRRTQAALPRAVVLLAVLVLPWSLGQELLDEHQAEAPEATPIKIAALQANLDRFSNSTDGHSGAVKTHVQLAKRAASLGAKLVIWPEAAWPSDVLPARESFSEAAVGVPTLMGASVQAPEHSAFNTALLLDGEGNIVQRYHKQHLVPFGEYVPLGFLLPLRKLVPGARPYRAGDASTPLGEWGLGATICYDGIFPEITRNEVRAGAKLLVNLTNDAWYGISSAPYQHRDFYIMRAVESGRWLVRAANTGISGAFSPGGELVSQTSVFTRDIAMVEVFLREDTTFYVRFGNWFVALCLGVVLFAGLRWAAPTLRRR